MTKSELSTKLIRNIIGVLFITSTLTLKGAEPFKLIVIPDSQHYFHTLRDEGIDIFRMQTQWIKDNITTEKIVFVSHVGDVIHDSSTFWPGASDTMAILDNNTADGVVPYSVTKGNHDGGITTKFNASRYNGYNWYLDGSDDDLAHAQIFSGGGMNFLHINLPHACNATHRSWAQGIIDANPNKPTIISTHGYFNERSWGRYSSHGGTIWTDLIETNPQVFMTLSGHNWTSRHEIDSTTDGRKIIQVQCDWQEIVNGGNGLLSKVIFDTTNSKISVKSYSPFLGINHTDWTGEFEVNATFNLTANTIQIGDEINAPKIWSGGDSNNNWQTADNWEGPVPAVGSRLRFGNVSQKSVINDFPVNSSFSGIIFDPGNFSNGYTLSGNAVTLTGDIVNMGSYATDTPKLGPKINFPIILSGDRQFNTGDWDLTINSVISGSGSLTKTHGRDYMRGRSYDGGVNIGDLYLTENCTYTGETRVAGGALILEKNDSSNTIANSPLITLYYNCVLNVTGLKNETINLINGQTLRGANGKVLGNTLVTSGSNVSPGIDGAGKLFHIGNLSLETGASLDIEIGGTNSNLYDQVDVSKSITINNSILNLTQLNGYTPIFGDRFIIVSNSSTSTVTGNFVSGTGTSLPTNSVLADGTLLTDFLGISGVGARIFYNGGDGNDIVLAVVPVAGSPKFINKPIHAKAAKQLTPYHASIATEAVDFEDKALTFSKISGPNWLTISQNGTISGTPKVADEGDNYFNIKVVDSDSNSDTAILVVNVSPQNTFKIIGRWDFDNPDDLTAPTIGNPLQFMKKNTTTPEVHTAIEGINLVDGAVTIGKDNYYKLTHNIPANGGGSKVNEYTFVFDIRRTGANDWKPLFETSTLAGGDADCFIRGGGGIPNSIGVSATGYTSSAMPADQWTRVVISVSNGNFYKIYIDGELKLNGKVQSVDGRYSLSPEIYFFGDNNSEDSPIDVTSIQLYNAALNAEEVAALGNVTKPQIVPIAVVEGPNRDGFTLTWEYNPSCLEYTIDVYQDANHSLLISSYSNVTSPFTVDVPMEIDSYYYYKITAKYENLEEQVNSGVASRKGLTGLWEFSDNTNLVKATVGPDLETSGTGFSAIAGNTVNSETEKGAVTVAKNSHYMLTHGLPQGDQYTYVVDFKIPTTGKWYPLMQTDVNNSNDGDLFVRTNGTIGLNGSLGGYSGSVADLDWHRLFFIRAGNSAKIYLFDHDGTPNGNFENGLIKTRNTSNPKHNLDMIVGKLIVAGDDSGDDGDFDISQIAIYFNPLSESDVLDKTIPGDSLHQPAVAHADSYKIDSGTTISGNVQANDKVLPPTILETDAILVTSPTNSNGFTFNVDGTFEYNMDLTSDLLIDTFSYKLHDGTAESNIVTVSLNLLKPPLNISASNVTANGFDLSWTAVANAESYTITVFNDPDLTEQIAQYTGIATNSYSISQAMTVSKPIYCHVSSVANLNSTQMFSTPSDLVTILLSPINKSRSIKDYSFTYTDKALLSTLSKGKSIKWTNGTIPQIDQIYNIYTQKNEQSTYHPIPLGFSFNYCGNNFTHFDPRSDVHVVLHNGTYNKPGDDASGIIGRSGYKNALAVLSSNQKTCCNIQLTGSVGQRVMTIEYFNLRWPYSAASNRKVQIKLYESDYHIEYIYDLNQPKGNGDGSSNTTHIGLIDNDGAYISIQPSSQSRSINPIFSNSLVYNVTSNLGLGEGDGIGDDVMFSFAPILTPAIGFEAILINSTLSWTVEEEIGVKKYVIKDSSGNVITTVIADGSNSYHIELPEGITDVVIEIVDNDGSSQTYAPENGNKQITFYDLEKGWNLISITSDNADLSELENVASGAIWAWNEESYTSVESAEATNAVWVYMNSAKQVKIIGEKSDATINLSSGWNLVGPVENIHIPEKVLSTYSWNSISEMYQNITKDSILQEGVGYWLFSF